MISQYRRAIDRQILELPAGTRGWDEAWLTCAQRELREETGLRAATFTSLGEIWPTPGISDELMHLYLAETLTPDPLPGDIDEQISLAPRPLVECLQMAQDGRLQDAKSIVGIMRAAVYLLAP
jgi:ADP-ribose pyrophosphatase